MDRNMESIGKHMI